MPTVSRFKGLFTQPGQIGTVPDGALAQADNIVITNDGQIETRRGTSIIASKVMTKLIPYAGRFVGHDRVSGTLSYGSSDSTTWIDYAGSYPAPTADQIRAAAINSNLYFTTGGVPYRLDSIAGTPEPLGIWDALDVQPTLSGATGSAIPGNTRAAYRIVFGKRDANGTTILGGPSGRYVLMSPALTIAVGNLVRSGTTVTATLNAGDANPFQSGETIYLTPGETNFPVGNKTITGVTSTTITWTEAGSAVSSTAAQTIQYPTRDALLTYSIPQGMPSGAFVRAYRSQPSATATVDPGDELGLVYEGSNFPVQQAITQLSRATNVVTATTAQPHGYTTGMVVRVGPGGSAAAQFVAVNNSSAATSPDGTTWTPRTMPAGTFYSVAWNGTVFVAVGTGAACASTPDGVTWTGRTIPAGDYYAVAWTGALFVAVGANVCATSPDGVTWTPRAIPAGTYDGIAWSGSTLVAVGFVVAGVSACASSPDGVTWAPRTLPAGTYYGVAWNGARFVAVGASVAAASPDGATWASVSIPAGTYQAVAWNGSVFAAVGTTLCATSSTGLAWTPRTIPAGAYQGVTWNGSAFVAVGVSSACASSPDGTTWTARTIPAGSYHSVIAGGGASFSPVEKTIASVPTPTTFTYADAGTDGTLVQGQTATPLTGAIVDQTPAYFIGAALYTNPSQYGMAGSAVKLWGARDIAAWRGTAFYANITYPSSADLYLLAVSDGTSGGIRAGDVITIDGLAYTASATTESLSGRTFKLSASTSPGTRLFETAQSLIRVINRTQGNTISAQDTSSATDPGPRVHLQETNTSTTLSVSFTGDAASWSIANLVGPKQRLNELRWSSPQQPDVVPALNYTWIGSAEKAILRIVPTRSALYVLKEDGIWLVSGYSSPWSFDPFDPTIQIIAPESAAVLDNQVYCLSRHGVMRIADTGVTVVSRPIENLMNALLTSSMRTATATYAFGISDEHDHKYYLWVPQASTDTVCPTAYVYDYYTDTWTARTDPMAHGIGNPADDRIYFVNGTSVRQERRSFQATDLADETYAVTINSGAGATSLVLADATNALVGDVIAQGNVYGIIVAKTGSTVTLDRAAALSNGAALIYRAIATTTRWSPKFGQDPTLTYRFREVGLLFRDVYFAAATIGVATDWSPAWTDIAVAGSDYGWSGSSFPAVIPTEATPTTLALRALVDLEHGRGTELFIRWQHAQAWSPMKLQALNTVVTPVSTRIGR